MINVGIVGLDTSHPEAFAEQLESHDGATVSAVWDSEAVRSRECARSFASRFNAVRHEKVSEMVGTVDAVMILTVNWDTHRRLAVPFLEAGIPTFVDKPIAGRLADIEVIAESASGTPLFGGSAVPFHPSMAELPIGQTERTLFCAGYNDPFYYGVHLTDTVRLLTDADWTVVEPTSGPGTTVQIGFENGNHALIRLDGPQESAAFAVLDVGNRTRMRLVNSDQEAHREMYANFIDAFLAAVRGEREDADRLLDSARLLLAIHTAIEHETQVVPESPELESVYVDGEAFVAEYTPYF